MGHSPSNRYYIFAFLLVTILARSDPKSFRGFPIVQCCFFSVGMHRVAMVRYVVFSVFVLDVLDVTPPGDK